MGEFDIDYKRRPAIKAQALADFITEALHQVDEGTDTSEIPLWTLHVDGSSTNASSGAGLVLRSPDDSTFEYALRFGFRASNNEAEYEALVTGLQLARQVGAQRVQAYSDSQLVVSQVKGDYEATSPTMGKYLAKVKTLSSQFMEFSLTQIPRSENSKADSLSKIATSEGLTIDRPIYLECKSTPSVDDDEQTICSIEEGNNWMQPIVTYLRDGSLPSDKVEAKKLQIKAVRYVIIDDTLYKRSYSLPLLRCVGPNEAEYLLKEIHEGTCADHVGATMLALKILRQGYFWPSMKMDALEFVRKCEKCQIHAKVQHVPSTELTPLSSPWPFAQWGIDLMGPFPPASGQRKSVLSLIHI